MDKENGKGNSKGNSGTSKLSNSQDPDSILDAASLFGAYWPRGDAAAAANMFAGFGLPGPPHHQSLQYGMPPPGAGGASSGGGRQQQGQQGLPPAYPATTSASAAAAAAAYSHAYSNAYNNTLSVAASQAASLGIPAASAAWWSMASHLAAQDYLARLQASGLSFAGLSANPAAAAADLQYSAALAAAGLPSLAGAGSAGGHHGAKASKGARNSAAPLSRSQNHSSKSTASSHSKSEYARLSDLCKTSPSIPSSRHSSISSHSQSSSNLSKYSQSVPGLSIQPAAKTLPDKHHQKIGQQQQQQRSRPSSNDMNYMGKNAKGAGSPGVRDSGSASPGMFSSPLSLVAGGGVDKQDGSGGGQGAGGLSSSILSAALEGSSDPNSLLGGVRLPPDTEIIKYTSSIVGPKIPGTTNRGRKKTISLDPPSVSLHPSTGLMVERTSKRAKLNDSQDLSPPSTPTNDRVEVIKLPATNGSPSGGLGGYCGGVSETGGEAPLNLSLKPGGSGGGSSSLASLSHMSANIGAERISRRKPGPKPRRCIPSSSQIASPPPVPPQQSSSLSQTFSRADSPRPPSRNEGSDGGSSTSSASNSMAQGGSSTGAASSALSKEGRPRNLGRGVSKPKKNTVASLLAQSRALGIKPVPMLDPNISMNQQMNLLKSNILAAQQYLSETAGSGGGGAGSGATAADEKALNRFIQEKLRGALSDSSTVDATSDSDNLTDSNHTDSEMEADMVTPTAVAAAKKQKHYDERLLRVPLEKGWKRETIIRGLTKNGGLRGDVTYAAPDSSNKFKQMSDVTQYLEYQKNVDLSKDHFTFSCRCIIGDYLQPVPPEMQSEGGEFIHLTEEDVIRRLEELKSAMRTSLPVEQRIEMARKQQAARAAARLDREQARIHKEIERTERQEQARREREARSQQMMEAKRKRQEEMERHKHEEQQRKQQERELKRQQAAILKEQMYIQEITKQREMLYTVELERERRRQHMALVKSLESRRKLEEREKKKQQLLAEKMANKEKKMEQRRVELEILTEIRRPCEDLELDLDQNPMPEYERIPGLQLSGKAFADTLMVFEFLHNFGETLGFDMESLPTLGALQRALLPNEQSQEAEDELFSVMTHLLVCAIEDPGIPNPARYTTMLGQSLRQADITPTNISEILRIYLYANATGEVKALTGVHFERDREKRVADHHQNDEEMSITRLGKNSSYYEALHSNPTFKLSDLLKNKPFMSLTPTTKVEILAFICNELLQNKAVIRQIESSLESCAQQKKEKWLLDMKIRKLKMLHNRKVRTEAMEKAQVKLDGDDSAVDSPSLHKDDLLDEEENEMSENESVGTQPEEEEDNKLSGEELGKKLEKLVKTSETHLQTLNTASLQLRAICFGQDRFFRRYWSLPKGGGVFVEAMESADPDEFEEQRRLDDVETTSPKNGIGCLDELDDIRDELDEMNDADDDKEVSSLVGTDEKETENSPDLLDKHANEHRKTPNRLTFFENGETVDKSEHNLAELKRSVDDIVQNLERNLELEKEKRLNESLVNNVTAVKEEPEEEEDDKDLPFGSKKFNLFERLGQCMERENKTEEDLKAEVGAEVKEELKNEILNELKTEIKTELIKLEGGDDGEHRWFGILPSDGATCEGVFLTAGNKWENGGVGACTRDITELKIPVFPPPGSNSTGNYHTSCDSPAPLQMTADESAQLEHIKKHGMPRPSEKKRVPKEKRYGWWRITAPSQLRAALDAWQTRGARERELKRTVVGVMQSMYEPGKGRLFVEPGSGELLDLLPANGEDGGDEEPVPMEGDAPRPDEPASWRPEVARRVDMLLLEQVEALEDKVASASMQVKGWKIPSRDLGEIPHKQIVSVAKERLAFLELNIERRYLKPPLGINTGDPSLAAMSQESSGATSSCGVSSASGQASPAGGDSAADIPKGLATWREAINRCSTSAQLAMCLYALEASIAWDKSIMKANCQFCHSGDNEDKLLLCDGCDKGYHTYCFKPKMDNIPEGDWYCHECMNKATGERNCIVCGRKSSQTGAKLVLCDLCPRSYHTDCHQPPLPKSPRGKWYCSNCVAKKPHKKTPVKKNHKAPAAPRDGDGSFLAVDHPASPAPSHCSTATNEDLAAIGCYAQSDISNSSLTNIGSPSSVSLPPCPSAVAASAASTSASSAAAAAAAAASANLKKEKANAKRLMRELAPCKVLLEDLECHDDAWPFLLPVNTKQFPTYKKIIKVPMDLSTIKKRLSDMQYKSREEFCVDVRQIFNNCETFNEDDSPVGKAGHCMRQFFEQRWNELLCAQQHGS